MRLEVGKFYKDVHVETTAGLIVLHNVVVLDRITRDTGDEVVLSVSPSTCPEEWIVDFVEGDYGID